ncbi:hypothetical protein D3C80_1929160 [compost metagenome]
MEKSCRIVGIKILAAQSKDTGEDNRAVIRISLQRGTDLMGEIAALGAVGISTFADEQCFDVLKCAAQLFSRERPDDVRPDQPGLNTLGTQLVHGIFGRLTGGVKQK